MPEKKKPKKRTILFANADPERREMVAITMGLKVAAMDAAPAWKVEHAIGVWDHFKGDIHGAIVAYAADMADEDRKKDRASSR